MGHPNRKVIVFNNKYFYNARHLYDHLVKNYFTLHPVSYYQVEEATGKKLKSIDKFYKVTYDYISKAKKEKLRRWKLISEGYEEIIAFDVKTLDDFVIKYAMTVDTAFLYVFKNTRDEITLAFKPNSLIKLAQKYSPDLWEAHYQKILDESELKNDHYYYYELKPTPIKQNIF